MPYCTATPPAHTEKGIKSLPEDEYSWIARGLFRVNVKNDRRGAVADFKKALELNPRFVPAWQNIANALADIWKMSLCLRSGSR